MESSSSSSDKTSTYQNGGESSYNHLFNNLKSFSGDDGDMVLEANVRKELCSIKSGTRAKKYGYIDEVLKVAYKHKRLLSIFSFTSI